MNAEYRKRIIDVLQEIQDEVPTHQLVYDGVHIWPIIKFHLFLMVRSTFTKSKTPAAQPAKSNKNIFQKLFGKINLAYQYFHLTKFYLKKNQVLSTGDYDHRVFDSGVWLNRYFLNFKKDRIHFELTPLQNNKIELSSNTFISEDLYYFHKHYFSKSTPQIKLDNDELIKKIVDLFNQKMGVNFGYSDFNGKLNNIFVWADLWGKILSGTKPKEIRMLCYYGTAMYGLCIAGNRLSIPVIDMQHGVFGDLNPDYRYFGTKPENAVSSIPSHFSVWNLRSKQQLEKEQIVNSENILLEGNPWVIYNQQKYIQSPHEVKTNIVYTLQTTVEVPSFMFDVIRETTANNKWILKTHPRMTTAEVESVTSNLQDLIKQNKVEINLDTHLLALLQTAKLHVSGFSGSIIEAGLLEVPTLINDRIGLETYRNAIDEQPELYKYAETKEEFMVALSGFVSFELSKS